MSDPTNILDVLSGLQSEINTLKEQNLTYEKQLNQVRLGIYIPSTLPDCDVRPITTRCVWSLVEIMKQPDGLDTALNIQKCIINIAAEASDLVETFRSKKDIKIRLDEKDVESKKSVEKLRKEKSPEGRAERLMLTAAEKAVRAIIGKYKNVSQTNLIPIVKAFIPSMSDNECRETLESLFAKIAKKGESK